MAKRKMGIFILILVGVAFFPGWQIWGWNIAHGADPAAAKASDRPMVWAVKTEARGLDPHQFDYDYDQKPQRASLEPLMEYKVMPDRSLKIVGVLAESWKGSADAKVWTFQLRKGIKFHDKTPWNAQVAKWNFERLFALNKVPATRIPQTAWPDKGGIEAVDDQTLRITLRNPFAPFVELLVRVYMISPAAAKANEKNNDWGQAWCNENMVGTGPFLMEKWVKGQYIGFKRNPAYWGGWAGKHAQRIIFRYVPEAATHRLLLTKGDVDLSEKIELDDLDDVAKVPGVVVEQHRVPRLIHLFMIQQGPFKDVRVRKAIAHVFDYDAFIKGVWKGRATKALSPLPSAIWSFAPQTEIKQDLNLAKKLLTEAGHPPGSFTVTIYILSSYGWFQPREAQILQADLKKLGIESKIQDIPDAGAYISAIKKPDVGPAFFAWTFANAYNDPEDNMRRSYHSKGSLNFQGYKNPKVDELIDKGSITLDQKERLRIYGELQKRIWEEYPALFTAEEQLFITRRDTLHGYDFYPLMTNISPNWYQMWVSDKTP